MVVKPDDLGCVELGGEELPAARLQEALEFDPEDAGLAAALARHVALELDDEAIPATWLLLVEEPNRLVVGGVAGDWEEDRAREPPEGPWTMVELVRDGSDWSVRTDQLGIRPQPTRRARGRGLSLDWPAGVIEHRSGCVPALHLQLRNDSTSHWEDREGRDLVAFVCLVGGDAGTSKPSGHTTRLTMLLGGERHHHHRLPPGGVLTVSAVVPTVDLDHLPRGRYRLEAALTRYDLTASVDLVLT